LRTLPRTCLRSFTHRLRSALHVCVTTPGLPHTAITLRYTVTHTWTFYLPVRLHVCVPRVYHRILPFAFTLIWSAPHHVYRLPLYPFAFTTFTRVRRYVTVVCYPSATVYCVLWSFRTPACRFVTHVPHTHRCTFTTLTLRLPFVRCCAFWSLPFYAPLRCTHLVLFPLPRFAHVTVYVRIRCGYVPTFSTRSLHSVTPRIRCYATVYRAPPRSLLPFTAHACHALRYRCYVCYVALLPFYVAVALVGTTRLRVCV